MVAGRCSAAQAECLRKVRDEKTYLKFAANWAGFCESQLKISKRNADRAIALLKKHGTLYFETAALTGITPAEFERIEHAIQRDGIHLGSDVIALIPENAARAGRRADPRVGKARHAVVRQLSQDRQGHRFHRTPVAHRHDQEGTADDQPAGSGDPVEPTRQPGAW